MSAELIESAKITFASEVAFGLKALNYHHNVEGADFTQYREFFGSVYKENAQARDEYAVHLRTLQTYVPYDYRSLSVLTELTDQTATIPVLQMATAMLNDVNLLITQIKETQSIIDTGTNISETLVTDSFLKFLIDRLGAYSKLKWMLTSILK